MYSTSPLHGNGGERRSCPYLTAQPAHPINMHLQVNKGKRCVALDLKKPKGVEAMHRLVRTADAFVTNAVGSKNDKIGIGYEQFNGQKRLTTYYLVTGRRSMSAARV